MMRPGVASLIAGSLLLLQSLPILAQEAVQCEVMMEDGNVTVAVTLTVPHSDRMLIVLPDERRIYLRDSDTPIQYPDNPDFSEIAAFTLDTGTRGTWFNDWGESEIVSVIGQSGKYTLLIDNDLDGRMTTANSCTFQIPVNSE